MTDNSDSLSEEDQPEGDLPDDEESGGEVEQVDSQLVSPEDMESLQGVLGRIVQEAMEGSVFEYRYQRSAPLPTHEEFKAYGEVLPSAPERIMRMAENASDSIIEERRKSQRNVSWIIASFLAAVLIVFSFGAYLAHLGYDITGAVTSALSFVGILASVFVRRWLRRGADESAD